MKYCPKCGNANEDAAQFCVKCGNAFDPAYRSDNTTEVTDESHGSANNRVESQAGDDISLTKVIGIIIAGLIILIGLGFWGHNFYLNHRPEQRTADVAQTIADKDFGDDEVQIYYSKKSNTFTIKPLAGTKSNIKEYVFYGDNQSDIDTINSNYKAFIADLSDHMGSNTKNFETNLTNPWNSDRMFISSTGTKETYNILHD